MAAARSFNNWDVSKLYTPTMRTLLFSVHFGDAYFGTAKAQSQKVVKVALSCSPRSRVAERAYAAPPLRISKKRVDAFAGRFT